MKNESLRDLINKFISYKKQNGYVYQAGTYYLSKYVQWVMETGQETAILGEKVWKNVLKTQKFYTLNHFAK